MNENIGLKRHTSPSRRHLTTLKRTVTPVKEIIMSAKQFVASAKQRKKSRSTPVSPKSLTPYTAKSYPLMPTTGNLFQEISAQEDSLQNIIPEIRKVLNPQLNIFKRLFWILAVLCCAAICVYQFQDRLLYYLENPVTTVMTLSHTQTINFPAVTICPSKPIVLSEIANSTNSNQIKDTNTTYLDKTFRYYNTTLENTWSWYSLMNDSISVTTPCMAMEDITNCDESAMAQYGMDVEHLQTMHGSCIILTPRKILEYQGPNTYLFFRVNHSCCTHIINGLETDIQIIIHSPGIRLVHDSFFLAEYMYKSYRTKMRFVITEFAALNRSESPCDTEKVKTDCRNQCIDEKLKSTTGINCRLPFMAKSGLPDCETLGDAKTSYDLVRKFYTDMKNGDCLCSRTCNDTIYRLSVDVEGQTNGSETEFVLYYADNLKETVTESFAYRFTGLVSDVGGSLGFFLGVCCLSVLQIVEKFFETALTTLCSFRKTRIQPVSRSLN